MKLNCIAIDDEPLALKQICNYIEKTPFLALQGDCTNPIDALNLIREQQPDLLFVDINMPELNGVELVKTLSNPPMIIFTTAYSQYALEGFKLDAVDYLLKPISYPDFLKAANKANDLYALKHYPEENLSGNDEHLFVKSDYRLVRIPLNNVRYIESMREYIGIHLIDGTRIMTLVSMKSIEHKLPKNRFMRVHRSYIVNLDEITIIERQRIVFDKKIYIPIGEHYKEEFEQYVKKNFI